MKIFLSGIITVILFSSLSCLLSEEKITHFRQAKKALAKIYKDRQIDFYCGCKFNRVRFQGYSRLQLAQDCGVKHRSNPERAYRVEWEHIVSAHAFGKTLSCWREEICESDGRKFKGRRCCVRTSLEFSLMEADMHNLFPVPGELNADRSNYHFGILPDTKPLYGDCNFKVDFGLRLAEPPPEIRGDIARAYFYMEDKYGVSISSRNRKLYEVWNQEDPPDDWERERNERIQKIQGNDNPFITFWTEDKQ